MLHTRRFVATIALVTVLTCPAGITTAHADLDVIGTRID